MRRWYLPAIVAGLAAPWLFGCGSDYPLPTETRAGREFSSDKSYQMVATWKFGAGDTVADILLTQGNGSQLFVLFNHAGAGPGPRGTINSYSLKGKPPTPPPDTRVFFNQLFVPVALAGRPNRNVFVLDQGDTCMARRNPDTGSCDTTGGWSLQISDLSSYWRVREYGQLGRDTLSTFTDTSLAFVRGIAVDDQDRVYVSGTAIVLVSDPQDTRIKTRVFQFRVNRYIRTTGGNDPYMPGATKWTRDNNFIVEEGSGLGSLTDPRGLYWAGVNGVGGPGLFAADFGKDWVQKLSDASSSNGLYKIDADTSSALSAPVDVTTSLDGFVYITDTGNGRVLRYDPYGQFVQRVDVSRDADGQPLVTPLAVAADDTLVYVGDRSTNKVIRYRRHR